MLIDWADLQAAGVEPHLVLHVGAHRAEEAYAYSSVGADVIWVEAQRDLAEELALSGYDSIHAAIWSEPTLLTFHRTSNGQSSSLLPLGLHRQRYPDITVTSTEIIETTTIDALNVKPDMLNLDIQGAELEALKGAERTLAGVRWIYTEISIEQLYQGQPLEAELTQWLEARGFKQALRVLTDYGWGDSLYVRSRRNGNH